MAPYLGAGLGPAKVEPRTDSGGRSGSPGGRAVEPPVERQEPPHVLELSPGQTQGDGEKTRIHGAGSCFFFPSARNPAGLQRWRHGGSGRGLWVHLRAERRRRSAASALPQPPLPFYAPELEALLLQQAPTRLKAREKSADLPRKAHLFHFTILLARHHFRSGSYRTRMRQVGL